MRFVAFTKEKHSIKLYKTMFSITWLYKKMPGWHTNICTTLYKEPHTPLQLKLCTVIQVYLMIRQSHNGHMTHHVYYLIYTCGIIKFCGGTFLCEFRRLAVPWILMPMNVSSIYLEQWSMTLYVYECVSCRKNNNNILCTHKWFHSI